MSNDASTAESISATRWPTLQFFVILLIVVGGISTLLSSLGCWSPGATTGSQYTQQKAIQEVEVGKFLKVDADTRFRPGDRIDVTMQHSGKVDQFIWTPPNGATNIRFLDVQPAPGGPPFNFPDVDATTAGKGIHIAYDAPPQGATFAGVGFLESSQMYLPDGSRYVSAASHLYPEAPPDAQEEVAARPTVGLGAAPQLTSTWSVNRFIDPPNVAMSTAQCQQYMTDGQSANVFIAIRVPTPDPGDTDFWPILPLISSRVETPTLSIIGAAGQFKAPLVLRPEAMQWAQAMLPVQTGQTWLALGIDPDAALVCPDQYDMPAGQWSFFLQIMLDFGEQPDACIGCQLPTYICYRNGSAGQADRFGRAASTFATDAGGFTCLGPNDTVLAGAHEWRLDAYTAMVNVTATHPITVHYWVENYTAAPQTFALSLNSDLAGATWDKYRSKASDWEAPDLTKPVGDQLNAAVGGYDEPDNHIWLLANAPAGASGQHTVSLTLANANLSPASSRGTTVLWVGGMPVPLPVEPAVAITKTAAPDPVAPGALLTYSLWVMNTGSTPIHELVIQDAVPISTTLHSCGGADACQTAGEAVQWELADLGAGLMRVLTLVVQVDADAPIGGVLRNQGYEVTTREGVSATGLAVETLIASGDGASLYLPAMRK